MNNKIMTTMLLSLAFLPAAAQRLSVSKGTVEMGKVAYSQPVTATFELRNKGLRKLKIEDVKVSCGCLGAEYPQGEIGSGDKFTLKLTYDARQLGHFQKTAAIYSNGSKKPVYLTMKGVVVESVDDFSGTFPYQFGEISADKSDLEFDDVNKGDHPVQEIHIRNTGSQVLTPNLMHLPPYLSAVVSPEKLRPGHTGKITVMLNSAKLHDFGVTRTSVYLGNRLGDKVGSDNEISVSAVLLPGFDGLSALQRKNAPHVSLSATDLDFDFEGKDKRKGNISLTNEGRTDLKIASLHMFGKGFRMTLDKQALKPGETADLKVTAFRDELKQSRVKPRILLITNDPDHPKVVININAQ